MHPSNNSLNYRAALKRAPPPSVPFLGVHLGDLIFAHEAEKKRALHSLDDRSVTQVHNYSIYLNLIESTGCICVDVDYKVQLLILELETMQRDVRYRWEEVVTVKQFLESEKYITELRAFIEEKLYQRSYDIEPKFEVKGEEQAGVTVSVRDSFNSPPPTPFSVLMARDPYPEKPSQSKHLSFQDPGFQSKHHAMSGDSNFILDKSNTDSILDSFTDTYTASIISPNPPVKSSFLFPSMNSERALKSFGGRPRSERDFPVSSLSKQRLRSNTKSPVFKEGWVMRKATYMGDGQKVLNRSWVKIWCRLLPAVLMLFARKVAEEFPSKQVI